MTHTLLVARRSFAHVGVYAMRGAEPRESGRERWGRRGQRERKCDWGGHSRIRNLDLSKLGVQWRRRDLAAACCGLLAFTATSSPSSSGYRYP